MTAPTITRQQLPHLAPSGTAPRARDAGIAGVLLSLAGVVLLLGFITAEALYPGVYSTHANTVSHLGASEPPGSVVLQPSAAIFDGTMLVAGAMIVAGAWFAWRALRRRAVLVPTAILGAGALGVGVFPLTHPTPHTLFAFTAFLSGGIAVIVASRVAPGPFRHLWGALGTVALAATVLGVFFLGWAPVAELGEGGIERWIVYPIVLWLVAFGSWLLAVARPPRGALWP